jgi:hypothetical protein
MESVLSAESEIYAERWFEISAKRKKKKRKEKMARISEKHLLMDSFQRGS